MKTGDYIPMVASALTAQSRWLIKDHNNWKDADAKTILNSLVGTVELFFANAGTQILITNKYEIGFNLPASHFVELFQFFDSPLDFIDALENSIVKYLTNIDKDDNSTATTKESTSYRGIEPIFMD